MSRGASYLAAASRMAMPLRSRRRAGGQTSAEYVIGCAVAVALLAVPIGDQPSVLGFLFASVKTGFAHFAAAIAMP